MMQYLLIFILLIIVIIHYILQILININRFICKRRLLITKEKVLAFFHPYCDNGGGGERVLWIMIEALLSNDNIRDNIKIIIYNGNTNTTTSEVIMKVKNQFKIDLSAYSDNVVLVNIRTRYLLEPRWYPVATMICQCLASIIVGLECLIRLTPDIYIDTTGAAFIYPLAKYFFKCKTVAYVHYPIISSDMLKKVRDQRPSYNNNERIATNVTISRLKLLYYNLFAQLYKFVGFFADIVIVNSSWTYGHISQLWNDNTPQNRITLLYPPCNTTKLENIPLSISSKSKRDRLIVSIGQFRPEKDHKLQIEAFSRLKLTRKYDDVKLVIVGSTRNKDDEDIVTSLLSLIKAKDLHDYVEIKVNTSFDEIHTLLARAAVGLHTMWNEHFGISIVEMMAAGLVVVAHKSGGPLMDIVTSCTDSNSRLGYLAESADEYADCISDALDAYSTEANESMRIRARHHIKKFSDEEFAIKIIKIFNTII